MLERLKLLPSGISPDEVEVSNVDSELFYQRLIVILLIILLVLSCCR